jgi:hypothetical protein
MSYVSAIQYFEFTGDEDKVFDDRFTRPRTTTGGRPGLGGAGSAAAPGPKNSGAPTQVYYYVHIGARVSSQD